jgi:hypothetical protein
MQKEIGSLLPENEGMRVPASGSEHANCMSHRHTSTDTEIIVLTLAAPLWNKNKHKSCSRRNYRTIIAVNKGSNTISCATVSI